MSRIAVIKLGEEDYVLVINGVMISYQGFSYQGYRAESWYVREPGGHSWDTFVAGGGKQPPNWASVVHDS